MSKPVAQAINRYRADLREFNFLMFEQFKLGELLGSEPYDAWDEEQVRTVLGEVYRWACEVVGPLNAIGDAQGCRVEDGNVKTPDGFGEAWKKLYEAGWKSLGVPAEHGGAGAPRTFQVLVEEMLSGANPAFNMYPALTYGAGEVIEAFGTEWQRKTFLEKMQTGVWAGTMCLTEAHAGSDVGANRTRATRNADGTYSIQGTKIFISGGDNDLTENLVHLVLARTPEAPAGTKGLTLFIVPKMRVNEDGSIAGSNDVSVGGIEHKMGINGSATCVLNFGENGGCIGYPVGGEGKLNQGMSQMFLMMNAARIAVGLQGVSVASAAYLNALDYARERKQGPSFRQWKDANAPKVSIIEHADVRRMLLDMKCRVEGIRALAVKLANHFDRAQALSGKDDDQAKYHAGQVDLLVPLVKAYGTDQAFRVCETAIQTYGGVGYTRDYPVEQYCRDSKIFSIYEGTNFIQSMDLVGRKLGQAGGSNTQAFLNDVQQFVEANSAHPVLASEVGRLGRAQQSLGMTVMQFLGWSQSANVELVPYFATRFLESMSEVAVAWLLLHGAVLAHEKLASLAESDPDVAFYKGKIASAQYYARTVLPNVELRAQLMSEEDRTALEMADASFATI